MRTAERCKEISQGYAKNAYPWLISQHRSAVRSTPWACALRGGDFSGCVSMFGICASEVLMDDPQQKRILLPKPRGFCAGVIRAIDIVTLALQQLGRPVYVRKEIVHNRFVVDQLAAQGAIFVESLDEVPDGAVAIFSAHGVPPEVREEARTRRLRVIDATCPLVTKVHLEVIKYARENYSVILIGHNNHDEVIGTFGEAPDSIQVVSNLGDVDALTNIQQDRVVYTY